MKIFRIALMAVACVVSPIGAQGSFAALTIDGNGIEALQKRYTLSFRGTVGDGLRTVARRAQLDISFDESLPGLTSNVVLPDSSATLARLILRLTDAAKLSARVSRTGQIVIVKRVQRDSKAPKLTGIVRDSLSGEALGDVRVLVRGSSQLSASRGDGSFSVSPGDGDEVYVTFARIGYKPKSLVIAPDGDRQAITVLLTQAAIPLAAVRVSPGQFGVMEQGSGTGHTLSREQIRTNPQLGEDVFRAVNRLPGLAANDLSAKFFVRGGSGDELYVSLDGVELHEPFHLKDIDAALSIVDVESIGGIDLSTGGFQAEYGNRLTGVFRMSSLEPRSEGMRTAVGLSVTNVRMMSQGRFAKGKGGWIVSARRGYLDLALKLSNGDDSLKPRYYDGFAKVQYDLSPSQRVAFHVLDAHDRLKYLTENDPSLNSGYGSSYAWATWDSGIGSSLNTSVVASLGRLTWSRSGEQSAKDSVQMLTVRDKRRFDFGSLKMNSTWSMSDNALLRIGAEVKKEGAEYDYERRVSGSEVIDGDQSVFTDTTAFTGSPSGWSANAFATQRIAVSRFVFEVGARLDHQDHALTETQFSPRVSAAWNPLAGTTVRGAWGHYYQAQSLYGLQVQDGIVDFEKAERAEHRTLGIEQKLPGSLLGRVEIYERVMSRQRPRFINALNSIDVFPEATGDRVRFDAPTGEARGIEFRINPSMRRSFDWSATYALARVFDRAGDIEVPRAVDQRHTLSLEASKRATSGKWMVSAAWLYHSGWPYTPNFFRTDTVVATSTALLVNIHNRLGALHSGRLPAYYRLDLRATRYFDVRGGRVALFADIFNTLNRNNARGYGYDLKFEPLRIVRVIDSQVPRLPTAGITWEF